MPIQSSTTDKIAVIILNWNGKNDTLECLSSLERIDYPHVHILVVDNGSSDDSAAAIRSQFPRVEILETNENLGYAEGNNVGIRHVLNKGFSFILLLNNDTVVDPQFLSAFVSSIKSDPNIGILGAKNYLYEERNKLDHLGGKWNPKKASFDLIGLRQVDDGVQWENSQEIDYVCGCALFARAEIFERIGLLEQRFFLIWEETDFCFRASQAGYLVKTCPQAKLWHKVSASFVGGKIHSTYFWWRNRLLWIERNCPFQEKMGLYLKVLIPDILHIYKLSLLKNAQLRLLRLFRSKENHKKRHERVLKYQAALQGVKDYCLRRFGNGPSWIYTSKPES